MQQAYSSAIFPELQHFALTRSAWSKGQCRGLALIQPYGCRSEGHCVEHLIVVRPEAYALCCRRFSCLRAPFTPAVIKSYNHACKGSLENLARAQILLARANLVNLHCLASCCMETLGAALRGDRIHLPARYTPLAVTAAPSPATRMCLDKCFPPGCKIRGIVAQDQEAVKGSQDKILLLGVQV